MYSLQAIRQPSSLKRRSLTLPNSARNMGIHVVAGKGSGKSRLMGRIIGYQDFLAGLPVVILDPHGTTIDNFLDKVTYLTPEQQRTIADRLFYVDVSGKSGFVPSLPLYYRLPGDSLLQVAQRFLNVVKKLDPDLTSAPILGWNAIERVGTNVGMVLSALGYQISEAPNLLRQTEAWSARLHELGTRDPEAKPAVDYFLQDYLSLEPDQRRREAESFLSKVLPFTHDARMQAMFACAPQSLDWEAAVTTSKVVMLDFREETDPLQIRFKMLWLLNGLLEYIKRRGPTRSAPLSLVIDELAYLLSLNSSGHDLLSADLDELINKVARNNNVWLTLAHQEMYQLPETIQKTLMTMGTQILGVTTDEQAATAFARRYFRYRPYAVRKYQPVYHQGLVIDHTPVEFTADEQATLNSYRFTQMCAYQFWVAASPGEGSVQTTLTRADISRFDAGRFVNEALVSQLRTILARRSSRKVEVALKLIRERNESLELKQPTTAAASSSNAPGPQAAFVPPPRKGRRKGS